jgi:hypothetical protein
MDMARLDPDTVVIRDITPFAANLLRRIPIEADPGDDRAARGRLFSRPTAAGQGRIGRELNEEWKQFVEPDLRHLFQTANETVFEDLKEIKPSREVSGIEFCELRIPMKHVEQWLNSLNQARLVMAARNAFTDEELDEEWPAAISIRRAT